MKIRVSQTLDDLSSESVVICPHFEEDTLDDVPEVLRLGGDTLRAMLERRQPFPLLYELAFLPPGGKPGVLLVHAEARQDFDSFYLMRVIAAGSRYLSLRKYNTFAVVDRGTSPGGSFGQAAAEGLILGAYNAGLKRTKPLRRVPPEELTLFSKNGSSAEIGKAARLGEIIAESKRLARDLVNLPPNDLTPSSFASRAQDLSVGKALQVDALDRDAMEREGMGSLLGVASGSDEPPKMVILRYGDPSAQIKLAVVGKGLTFDSGGLSLKTAEGMETMKGDMGGAAAVLSGMLAVERLAPENISVTGYIGTTENMPSGKAMKPGDVLTAMTGETIEVLNTDAEGRLVLADLLAYAVREGATHLVDFATLTGSAVVALGNDVTLSAGKPAEWVNQVAKAAEEGLERAWPMPLYREYRMAMESDIADIKNSGVRWGGALNAAAFLSDFVDGVPWAHMDIAGTSWLDAKQPYGPAGGTGEGVGTIVGLVRQLSSRAAS